MRVESFVSRPRHGPCHPGPIPLPLWISVSSLGKGGRISLNSSAPVLRMKWRCVNSTGQGSSGMEGWWPGSPPLLTSELRSHVEKPSRDCTGLEGWKLAAAHVLCAQAILLLLGPAFSQGKDGGAGMVIPGGSQRGQGSDWIPEIHTAGRIYTSRPPELPPVLPAHRTVRRA